jgi:hypothetical protein
LAEVVCVDAHRHAGVRVAGELRRRRRVELEADDQVRRVSVSERVRRKPFVVADRDPGLLDCDGKRTADVAVPLRLPAASGKDGGAAQRRRRPGRIGTVGSRSSTAIGSAAVQRSGSSQPTAAARQ